MKIYKIFRNGKIEKVEASKVLSIKNAILLSLENNGEIVWTNEDYDKWISISRNEILKKLCI